MVKFNKYGQCEDNPHEWEDELQNRTTCKICGSIRLNSEALDEIFKDENSKEVLMNNPFIKESRECFVEDDSRKESICAVPDRVAKQMNSKNVPRGYKNNSVWNFSKQTNEGK